eukprot:TRINITY_DN7581_c0_g1_i1.p1 TRINITY_DN7581_c0_g1~~TRINITY_DN7581_c0_g1_i1.p1  ORF type:complete len:172 (+),score=16.98 TRINITY_DN7581_c0_g1_i1:244-759(+)
MSDPFRSVSLFADGSCISNPGPGGWACLIVLLTNSGKTFQTTLSGGDKHTTNNRMELVAATKGFHFLNQYQAELRNVPVYAILDSEYVKNGLEKWLANWKRNNWQTAGWQESTPTPVKNKDEWIELDREYSNLLTFTTVHMKWTKGHSDNIGNNVVDQLALAEARKAKSKS